SWADTSSPPRSQTLTTAPHIRRVRIPASSLRLVLSSHMACPPLSSCPPTAVGSQPWQGVCSPRATGPPKPRVRRRRSYRLRSRLAHVWPFPREGAYGDAASASVQ